MLQKLSRMLHGAGNQTVRHNTYYYGHERDIYIL